MRSGPGHSYIYRSLVLGGWMVVNVDGHEFGPYRWRWQARFYLWCIGYGEGER